MKTASSARPVTLALTLCAATLLLSLQSAQAATYDWSGGTSANMSGTPANWGGTEPTGTDVARWSSATYTNAPSTNAAMTIGELLFDAGNTAGVTFGAGTSTLTLNGISGVGMQLNSGTGAVSTGSAKFALGASQSWTNNSASLLTVGGTITNSGNVAPYTLTLDGSGTGGIKLSGIISNGGATGTTSLIINKGGTGSTSAGGNNVDLSGANTFTGGVTLNSGVLVLNSAAAAGTGTITVNGGTLSGQNGGSTLAAYTNNMVWNSSFTLATPSKTNSWSGNVTLAGPITVTVVNNNANLAQITGPISGGNGIFDVTVSTTGTGTLVYSQAITLTASQAATVNSGAILQLTGGISGSGFGITKNGTGKLVLSGGHSLTGTMTVNAGTLDLRDAANPYTNDINLAASTATLDAAPTTTSTVTINSNITGSGKINKSNSGATLILNGNNDYTGGTTLTDGTLVMGPGTNNGIGTGTLTLALGTLRSSDDNSRTIANAVTTSGATLTFGAAQGAGTGRGDLNFTNTTSGSLGAAKTWTVNNSTTATFANNWTGNTGWHITKAGTGTLVFNGSITSGNAINILVNGGTLVLNGGSSAFTGTTTVRAGTLIAGNNAPSGVAGAFGNASSAVVLADASSAATDNVTLLTSGAFTVGRSITVNSNNSSGTTTIGGTNATSTTATYSGAVTLNRNVALTSLNSGATTDFTGAISESGGARAVSINGGGNVGTVRLSGTNTYTGATTVSGGKLTIASTGTINNSSGVTIAGGNFNYNSATALTPAISFSGTGGTLSGSGTVGAFTLTSGNTVAPGNSPGTLTTGAETWQAGGTYAWEINNATGTQGTNWDFINSTGALDISALSSSSKFNVSVIGLTAGNVSGAVPNWTDADASWKIASFTSIVGSFASNLFNVDASGFTNNNTAAGAFTITNVGNDIYLSYTTVPEPSTYAALAGAAILGLAAIRRRRHVG